MKTQTKKPINVATLLPAVKVANKRKPKAVKPIYEHQQGDCTMPQNEVKQCGLTLVSLPLLTGEHAPTHDLQLKANHIDKVKPSQATISNGLMLNATKPQQTIKTPQTKATSTKFNVYGNSKGYGDKWPTDGTSAAAIWAALVELNYSTGSVTKIWVERLAALNLQCNKGRVNDNNLSIEINSFKRYLINHNMTQAPKKAA
jgi:hypothetical protein